MEMQPDAIYLLGPQHLNNPQTTQLHPTPALAVDWVRKVDVPTQSIVAKFTDQDMLRSKRGEHDYNTIHHAFTTNTINTPTTVSTQTMGTGTNPCTARDFVIPDLYNVSMTSIRSSQLHNRSCNRQLYQGTARRYRKTDTTSIVVYDVFRVRRNTNT